MESFDPFAVLGLARRYDMDAREVEQAYLERSAALHPDMVAHTDLGIEDGDAEERISELNRAKQMADDPEQRAASLWRLWGGVEDKALPPQFLMEMMEVREEIAGNVRDPAGIAKWEAWAEERRGEYQRRVGELFGKLSAGAATNAATLRQIKMELNAWRYIERLVEQLGA